VLGNANCVLVKGLDVRLTVIACRMKSSPYFLTRTVEHTDIERFSDQRTKSVTQLNYCSSFPNVEVAMV
jgi:hypothetical protein